MATLFCEQVAMSLVSTAASIAGTKFPNKRRKNMRSNLLSRPVLICVLCLALVATGCSAQWISVALADLPMLTQMALNIATLVNNVHSSEQLASPATSKKWKSLQASNFDGSRPLVA
jgi:hypothetical protein